MNAPSSTRSTEARAPTRIDLGGGWTDVPPFSDEEGGFVCNIAIDRYATAVARIADATMRDVQRHADGERALATAALKRAQIRADTANLSLELRSDFPVGAGLGGSSAAGVAALGALLAWQGESRERHEIAELSRTVEVEDLGVPGGRQDHYAAAFGGALGLTFDGGSVAVERIPLSTGVMTELEQRIVLLYTGQSRISGETISAVLNSYRARDERVCNALRQMRELARTMARLLGEGSIDSLAGAIAEQWIHQRSLHPRITTELIDHAMRVAGREGALGAKALGASGGGCVLFVARAGEQERLRRALQAIGELVPFRIDQGGLTVRQIDSTE